MKTYDVPAGMQVSVAARNVRALAEQADEPASADFNGIELRALPGNTVEEVLAPYYAEHARRCEAAERREEEERQLVADLKDGVRKNWVVRRDYGMQACHYCQEVVVVLGDGSRIRCRHRPGCLVPRVGDRS